MRLFYYLILFFISAQVHAQCNTKTFKNDNVLTIVNGRETIYQTEDYENGYLTSGINMISFIQENKNTKAEFQFGIYVYVGAYGSKRIVKPRELILSFTDGSMETIPAKTMKPMDTDSDSEYLESYFKLNEENLKSIARKALSKITIRDNRIYKSINCSVYKYLLKEQLECLFTEVQ